MVNIGVNLINNCKLVVLVILPIFSQIPYFIVEIPLKLDDTNFFLGDPNQPCCVDFHRIFASSEFFMIFGDLFW